MNVLDLKILSRLTAERLEQLNSSKMELELILSAAAKAYLDEEITLLTQKLSQFDMELATHKEEQMKQHGVTLHLKNVLYLLQEGEYAPKEAH